MIELIKIADIATYSGAPESLCDLSMFNFIFGGNATGKTTVSRVIANEDNFPSCEVSWKGGTKLQPMVYNKDFIDLNFNQSDELRGVFTLGERNVETINKIAEAKVDLDAITKKIETLNRSLQGDDGIGGRKGDLASLEIELKNKCWAQKQKHDAKLQGAFEGYRGSAEKFKVKLLQEWASNSSSIQTLADLEKKAATVFGPAPTVEKLIPVVDADKMSTYESDSILKKRVIGKDDVDIAAMIKKLGNSDWVREGREFYDLNEGVCPFCQEPTPESFARSLNEYFDEAFEQDSKAIDDLVTDYKTESSRILRSFALRDFTRVTSRSKLCEPLRITKIDRNLKCYIIQISETFLKFFFQ